MRYIQKNTFNIIAKSYLQNKSLSHVLKMVETWNYKQILAFLAQRKKKLVLEVDY